jgi:hypothetical protein
VIPRLATAYHEPRHVPVKQILRLLGAGRLVGNEPSGDNERETNFAEVSIMKRSEELKRLLRQRPFQPFRVHLDNGKVLDVVCPEITLVGEDMAIIGITDPKHPDPYSDDFEIVLMYQILRVETEASPSTPATA